MMGRSLVSDISHVSRVMVCVVLDMLHPAVRQEDAVASLHITVAVTALSSLKVGSAVVVMDAVLVVVRVGSLFVDRGMVYRGMVYRSGVYRSGVYRSVVYRSGVYRSVMYRSVVYRSREGSMIAWVLGGMVRCGPGHSNHCCNHNDELLEVEIMNHSVTSF